MPIMTIPVRNTAMRTIIVGVMVVAAMMPVTTLVMTQFTAVSMGLDYVSMTVGMYCCVVVMIVRS